MNSDFLKFNSMKDAEVIWHSLLKLTRWSMAILQDMHKHTNKDNKAYLNTKIESDTTIKKTALTIKFMLNLPTD